MALTDDQAEYFDDWIEHYARQDGDMRAEPIANSEAAIVNTIRHWGVMRRIERARAEKAATG